MHVFRSMVMVSMLGAAFAAGCMEGVEATRGAAQAVVGQCDDDNDYNCRCSGCGANGAHPADWNAMDSQADRNALDSVGAWDWSADGPRSLCDPSTVVPDSCRMHAAWSAWIGGNGRHISMMKIFVKLIALKGYIVSDPVGLKYVGEFGLAASALGSSWRYPEQEIVAAGVLALLDLVHGVPVCLKTELTPDNCATAGPSHHESTFFGNTFRVHYAAISGGVSAPIPWDNLRFGTAPQSSATAFTWQQHRCATTGTGETTLVAFCDDEFGRRWQWPVVVVTPFDPQIWYYRPGGAVLPKPTSIPPVH
jgi:hypothetical protein